MQLHGPALVGSLSTDVREGDTRRQIFTGPGVIYFSGSVISYLQKGSYFKVYVALKNEIICTFQEKPAGGDIN